MTPRINESNQQTALSGFSAQLLSQAQNKIMSYQLNGSGPLFQLLHPALIKCTQIFENSPSDLVFRTQSSGWNIVSYKNTQEAALNTNALKIYGGYPYDLGLFIKDNPSEALIDFDILGTVHLFKTEHPGTAPEKMELHHHLLPLWLDYALSPELWGPSGKWTRFHGELHTLFDHYGLFIDEDFPGFYPLKREAKWLSKHGFQGRLTNTNYDLIPTWDFPLSGLVELKKVLARGP